MLDKKEGLRVGFCDNFEDLIDSIVNFYGELLVVGYYLEIYVYYGVDDSCYSWCDLIWKGDFIFLEIFGVIFNDDENGIYNSWFCWGLFIIVQGLLEMGNFLDVFGSGGDEMVLIDFGQVFVLVGVKVSFWYGSKGKGQVNIKWGYEYQESYNDVCV